MKNKIDKKLKKNFRLLLLTSILSGVSGTGFAATITCTPGADGSYLPGNVIPSCNTVSAATITQPSTAGFYILTRSRLYETLIVGNTDVTANVTGGYGGIGNQYASGAAGASISTGDLKFKVTSVEGGAILGSHSAVNITTKTVDATLIANYGGGNSSGGVAQYGLLTGSTVSSGETLDTGEYSTITTMNLKLNQTTTGGSTTPILNNGIRAIQGATSNATLPNGGRGTAGQVIVNGILDMTLTGNRSVGIYVSGNATNHGVATDRAPVFNALTPKVILNNDAKIIINKGTGSSFTTWDSHGIKLGKVRYAGEGPGILESHGNLVIDTTNALQGGGIKMMRNSILDASDSNASTTIKTNGYALEIGGHDDAARNGFVLTYEQAASNGATASFNNAIFTTNGTSADPLITATGARKDLIFVDQGQVAVKLNFTGANTDLTANANGYILNVSGNYTAPNYAYYSNTYDTLGNPVQGQNLFEGSSVTFNATDAGSMTGLVYKGLVKNSQTLTTATTPTLNLNLSNGFTWNLNSNAAAPNADTTTAFFDTTTISNGAVINGAYSDAGGNNYILLGNVISDAGIINLDNTTHAKYNDVLTINGNYTGSNGALVKMNTLWNAPGDTEITVVEGGADSESDVLHITGTADGTTTVNPIASNGTNYVLDGSVQQLTKIINTVPVIIVDTTNAAGTFVGTAQTTGATEVQLTSRIAANGGREYYWTMAAMPIVDPVDPVDPVTPTPIYNPSVPGYVETPRVDMELGYATLRTLHERRGENQTLAWDECGDCGLEAKGQVWARIFGSHLEQDGKTRFGMDTDTYGIQAGYDFAVKRNDKDGHRLTGLYFAYGRANTDFSDKYRAVNGIISDDKYTGNGKTDAYSLGITNTYYKSNGTYIDLVGQASFLQNKYDSRSNVTANNNGFGLILSAEVGRPYAINDHTPGETGWLIEPQAQLIYQYLKLDKFSDGTRNIDQNSQSGLRGRIGFRIARNSEAKNYQTNTFYGVANVWHDFLNPKEVNIGQDGLKETYASTWGEIGLGVQFPLAKELYLYSDARYERSFGGADRDGYRGTLGLKYTWK